jgi:hypothetical protein
MLLKEFENMLEGKANTFRKDVIKELTRFRFKLEAQGKRNANDDFYQPTTRAGYVRDYQLTGRLQQSIVAGFTNTQSGFNIVLQAGGLSRGGIVDYADDLEFGTDRIKPFFFLGRAIQSQQDELEKVLGEMLELTLQPASS